MAQITLKHDKKGFTLIEVMVAMVIMLIGALGLLQTLDVAMEHTIKNQRREEVVRVAEEVMNGMRGLRFDEAINTIALRPTTTISSKLRASTVKYAVTRNATVVTADATQRYQVDVRWAYKNYSALHTIVTIRGN